MNYESGEQQMALPRSVCELFPPSDERLLDVLRPHIDDGMIREIAEADYRQGTQLHEQSLRIILAHGEVPRPLKWHPGEVLQLIRWSEPDDPNWSPGAIGVRGHWMRAISCAILLKSEIAGGELNEATLAQSLRSSVVLGSEVSNALGCFLTFAVSKCLNNLPWVAVIGLLAVAAREWTDPRAEKTLPELIHWILHSEECVNALHEFEAYPPFPNERHYLEPLIQELNEFALMGEPSELRPQISFIAATVRDSLERREGSASA